MTPDIRAYNDSQSTNEQQICDLLAAEISKGLPEAESKVWHAHPVWFLDGNPVVGYAKRKSGINLMFWSGQSFEEPDLKAEGKFKAAQVCFTGIEQVNVASLKRWLKKSRLIQWDYKNIVKRRGVLERLV